MVLFEEVEKLDIRGNWRTARSVISSRCCDSVPSDTTFVSQNLSMTTSIAWLNLAKITSTQHITTDVCVCGISEAATWWKTTRNAKSFSMRSFLTAGNVSGTLSIRGLSLDARNEASPLVICVWISSVITFWSSWSASRKEVIALEAWSMISWISGCYENSI